MQLNDGGEGLDDLSWLTQHNNEKSTANVGDKVHANDDFELDTHHKPDSLSNRNRTVYLRKRRRRNSAPIILSLAIIFFAISCAILVSLVAQKLTKPDLGITISDFFEFNNGEIKINKKNGAVTFIFPERSEPDSDTILWFTAQDPYGDLKLCVEEDSKPPYEVDVPREPFPKEVGSVNGRTIKIYWAGSGNVTWYYSLIKAGEKTLSIEGSYPNVDNTDIVLRLQPSGNKQLIKNIEWKFFPRENVAE